MKLFINYFIQFSQFNYQSFMNIAQRRLYMLSFVVTFLLTAPILVFLAKGYSFDIIGGVFVHNGAVIIKSNPKKVDLYLDGKKVSNKMLNIINNYYVINGVRFGNHTIEAKKDGYTTWKKKIDVHSGVSTEFWNILLFPKNNNTVKTYLPENIKSFYLSPRKNKELLLYKTNNKEKIISLFNSQDNQEVILYTTNKYDALVPDINENIEWSSNHKKILIPAKKNNKKDYIITDANNNPSKITINLVKLLSNINSKVFNIPLENTENIPKSPEELPMHTKSTMANKELFPEIYHARWMFNSDHQILVLTQNHLLFFVDINDITKTILLAKNVNGFDLAGDHVYYTDLTNNTIVDIKPNKPSYHQIITNINLDINSASFLRIFAYDELRITLITPNNTLYLFNNDKANKKTTFEMVEKGVINIQFSDDGKKFLYWTNFDLWNYMLRDWTNQPKRLKGEKIFITSFASGIKNIQWMETFENIIFTNNLFLKAVELDNRDHVNLSNIIKVNSLPQENTYIYDKATSTLYFLDKIKENSVVKLHSIKLIEHNGLFNFGK